MVFCNVLNANQNNDQQATYLDNFAFNASSDRTIISNKEPVILSNSTIFSKEMNLSGSQFKEDFDDCQLPTGWSNSSNTSFSSDYGLNNSCGMRVYANNSSVSVVTKSFEVNSTNTQLVFKMNIDLLEQYCYVRVQYDINGSNSWTTLQEYSNTFSDGWNNILFNLSTNVGDSLRLKFVASICSSTSYRNEARFYLDDLMVVNGHSSTKITLIQMLKLQLLTIKICSLKVLIYLLSLIMI